MEFDVLTQAEGVYLTVGADLPITGDIGSRLQIIIQGHQTAENLGNILM